MRGDKNQVDIKAIVSCFNFYRMAELPLRGYDKRSVL